LLSLPVDAPDFGASVFDSVLGLLSDADEDEAGLPFPPDAGAPDFFA
jgi:hypothetical protein